MLQHDTEEELKDQLAGLKASLGINELIYLSTCNRVTYFFEYSGKMDEAFLQRFYQYLNPNLNSNTDLTDSIIRLEGSDALMHLFEVAASIDSMVVGEREILRQLREAYGRCRSWGLTGDNIRLAMQATVQAAKEVYAKTRIGEKPISVVSLAIQQLLASDLPTTARILLLGAGQTNTLVAKFLKKHGFQNVVVFNRTLEKAKKLCAIIGDGRAYALEELPNYAEGFDAIITCTGHTQSWVDRKLYQQMLQGANNSKTVIDLAIPNNIQEDVRQDFDIHYIEIEALRQMASDNIAFRQKEVSQARELLDQQLVQFHQDFQSRSIVKVMHQVPAEIKAIKSHAMNQVFRKELEDLNPESRQLLERMMDYMERRCISVPMQAAKRLAE